jgi:(p)ppGpp synthase/HD superfamily hydrolase
MNQTTNTVGMILSARFESALVYATRLHRQQQRKVVPTPYIGHLLAVSALVLEDGGDEDEAIAALLRDAIEDQGGEATRREVWQRFGARVTAIVDGCTEPAGRPQEPWRQHKQRYLAKIQQGSVAVHRVALADKLHNGRSLWHHLQQQGNDVWQHFRASPGELLWLYETQVHLFESIHPGWMATELDAIVQGLKPFIDEESPKH